MIPNRPFRIATSLALAVIAFTVSGCKKIPGKPDQADEWIRPDKVTDFNLLYAENCAGCHSLKKDAVAASRPLNDPLYAAFIGRDAMIELIKNGVPGTAMPAYGLAQGGLTDQQVAILADGIIKVSGPAPVLTQPLPPYAQPPGNVETGQRAFAVYCASCHGADGKGEGKLGSIVDENFLDLISDQALRSLVATGRPDLKHPDRSSDVQGRTMSDQEVTDVVAWLSSLRPTAATIR